MRTSTPQVRVAMWCQRFEMLAWLVFATLLGLGCSKWQPTDGQVSAASALTTASARVVTLQQPTESKAMVTNAFQKPSDEQLRQQLEPISYEVTQHAATEPPFRNPFWDNHAEGLYVDVVSGEPLFSSRAKFDSGTGWPSFTAPVGDGVVARKDVSHGMRRTEVRSSQADSHLGHLFDDGPAPTGQRYCINSAALRFVPKAKLVEAGYGAFLALFDGDVGAPSDAGSKNSCSEPRGEAPGCQATLEDAYLAGGCFWGMQDILRKIPGVVQTEVGYMGGTTAKPTYEDVKTGTTGHAESVRIVFDPSKLAYADLLQTWFFRMHDPTTANRQGNDVGTQYRSVIFVTSPEQRKQAVAAIAQTQSAGLWKRPIVTAVEEAGRFTPAESYHQDYLEKHPGGYTCHYLR